MFFVRFSECDVASFFFTSSPSSPWAGWLSFARLLACLLLQYYRYRDGCSPKRICSFFIGYICQSCSQVQIFVASLLSSLVGSLVYGSFRIRICLIYLSDGSYCLLLFVGFCRF